MMNASTTAPSRLSFTPSAIAWEPLQQVAMDLGIGLIEAHQLLAQKNIDWRDLGSVRVYNGDQLAQMTSSSWPKSVDATTLVWD